jgi:hypothetical protein
VSVETKGVEQSKHIETVERDLENVWESLSIDEKMTNDKLSKKFKILRQLLATLRDLNRSRLPRTKAG